MSRTKGTRPPPRGGDSGQKNGDEAGGTQFVWENVPYMWDAANSVGSTPWEAARHLIFPGLEAVKTCCRAPIAAVPGKDFAYPPGGNLDLLNPPLLPHKERREWRWRAPPFVVRTLEGLIVPIDPSIIFIRPVGNHHCNKPQQMNLGREFDLGENGFPILKPVGDNRWRYLVTYVGVVNRENISYYESIGEVYWVPPKTP